MEPIDYTSYLDTIIDNLYDFELILEKQVLVLQQLNYLQMFLFGSIVAVCLVIIIKELF